MIRDRLSGVTGLRYVSADLSAQEADIHADLVNQLPFADHTFDVVICSHVLEHIHDDQAALREIHRVIRRGGAAFLIVPLSSKATTSYDPTVTDPLERTRRYGQEDHVRFYGQDFESLLDAVGWKVERIDGSAISGHARMALLEDEIVFVCHRRD